MGWVAETAGDIFLNFSFGLHFTYRKTAKLNTVQRTNLSPDVPAIYICLICCIIFVCFFNLLYFILEYSHLTTL